MGKRGLVTVKKTLTQGSKRARWRYDFRLPNGERKRGSCGSTVLTREEAVDYATRLRLQMIDEIGGPTMAGQRRALREQDLTLEGLIELWSPSRKAESGQRAERFPLELRHLRRVLTGVKPAELPRDLEPGERILQGLDGHRLVRSLEPSHLTLWAEEAVGAIGVSGKPLSASSVRRMINPLAAMLAWARARGLITRNPMREAQIPRAEFRPRLAPTREAIVEALNDVKGHHILEPWYLFAFTMGLDHSEVRKMLWDDVDLVRNRLSIPAIKGERGKTLARGRTLGLSTPVRRWLESQPLESRTGHVVGTGNSKDLSWARCKMHKKLGRTHPQPHSGRKYVASELAKRGATLEEVADLLGHDPATTRAWYRQLEYRPLSARLDEIDPTRYEKEEEPGA